MALDRKIYVRIGSLGSDRQADSCCVLLSAAVTDLDARVSTLEATVSNILPTVEAAAADATAAAAAAGLAETAAVAAAADATAAAASASGQAARFILPAASDPTTRDNGDPLQDGDLYLNTTENEVRIYNGGAWTNPAAPQGALLFQDEGSDLGTAGTVTTVNFTGSGVTASRAGNTVTVNVSGGGGGGGTVRDWDLTPIIGPAVLTLAELPAGFAYPNEGEVSAPTLLLEVPAGVPHLGAGYLGEIPVDGKVYWYWKPLPADGSFAVASNATLVGPNLLAPLAQFSIVVDAGLVFTSAGGSTVVDAAFSDGDVALVYLDAESGEVSVKTANGDFSAVAVVAGLGGAPVYSAVFGFSAGGLGELGSETASIDDLGSGLEPNVGFGPLSALVDAPLPAGSQPGDFLNVVSGGTWGGLPYNFGDGATVVNATPPAVTPSGVASGRVESLLAAKVTAPTYQGFLAQVGPGKTYADISELRADVAARCLSGGYLTLDLYDGADNGAGMFLSFPSFDEVRIQANGASNGTVDLGAANIEIYGGARLTDLSSVTLTTTGTFTARRFKCAAGAVVNCDQFTIDEFFSAGLTLNVANAFGLRTIRNCNWRNFAVSSVVVAAAGALPVVVEGVSFALNLETNVPVRCGAGSAAGLGVTYVGGDLTSTAVATVNGGGNFYFRSITVETASVDVALAVAGGGIASAATSLISSPSGVIVDKYSQAVNVATSAGLILADAP